MTDESHSGLPDPTRFEESFVVYEIDETADDGVRYYGEPLVGTDKVVKRVAPTFRERGYRVTLRHEIGEHVLVAEERSVGVDGIPVVNVLLAGLTLLSTLWAGGRWYGVSVLSEPATLLQVWPFAAGVLGILAVHEFGHYVTSRYHEVEASLPYFLPFPNLLGTVGAVIRMNDNMPDRRSLFDIGVSGPLAGVVATIFVAAVGVSLPPVSVGDGLVQSVELGYPLLIQAVAVAVGEPLTYADPTLRANPVVVAAWVGAFVTFLNLLPVGQLDGAHVLRSLVGERATVAGFAVPVALFGLAGYVVLFESGQSAGVWGLWGVLSLLLVRAGTANPIDETSVGPTRWLVGVLTLLLGVLCFAPVPIAIGA